MTYLERARLLHGKGEIVNAAIVLAEGLKRDRNNADAMEWFVSLYVREVPNPGLETDVISVLAVQDNAANLLSLIESDLISAGADSKLSALRKARSRDPQFSGAAQAVSTSEAAPEPAAVPAAEYWDAFASPLESDHSSPRNTQEAATVYADRAAQVPAQFRTISDLSVVDDLPFSPDEDFGQIQRKRWVRVAIAFGALVVASLLFYFFVIANPSTPVSGPAALPRTHRPLTMKAVLLTLLQLAALTASGAGCTIDFNEDISCETAANCPVGFGCDLTVARCVADPDGLLVQDTGTTEDTVDRPDLGGDTADTTVDSGSGDTSDTTESDGSAADTTADTEPPCEPSDEVCDGLDNDCDGAADNGIFCNGCQPGMARIERTGATAFCVDLHEASRQDATADAVGSDSSLATSRAGVQPWKGATFAAAGDACAAVGKRLCSDGEWVAACQGAETRLYPYAQLYAPTTCHGINAPPTSGPVATGLFSGCVSQDGLFDMSGNVEEWSADRRVRGGAFNDVQNNLKCTSADATVNPTLAQDSVGFRCCDDLI